MTQNRRVIVLAKEFHLAAVDSLERNLVKAGVRNIRRLNEVGIVSGEYDGNVDDLKALDNVEEARWENTYRLPPSSPYIPQ